MQFPKYFDDYDTEIKDMYKSFTSSRVKGRLGIHIRLGDYLKMKHKLMYFRLSKSDILKCLGIFNAEYKEIIIFTDSPDIAKTIVPENLPVVYDISKNEIECLQKMSSCEYFIASNSTFSWWACYLGNIPNVCVHYPWTLFAKQDSLYLPHWTKFNKSF